MPILSVKHIINAPNVTSTRPGLWPVQLKPFPPLPGSLMSPVCPSIPVLLGPLMLKSHKLEFVFRQVELFSCRHWQRAISGIHNSTAGAHVMYDCICEAHNCCCALTCGCDTPSIAHKIIFKGTPCFSFGLLHVWLTCLWTWIEFFLCCFVTW